MKVPVVLLCTLQFLFCSVSQAGICPPWLVKAVAWMARYRPEDVARRKYRELSRIPVPLSSRDQLFLQGMGWRGSVAESSERGTRYYLHGTKRYRNQSGEELGVIWTRDSSGTARINFYYVQSDQNEASKQFIRQWAERLTVLFDFSPERRTPSILREFPLLALGGSFDSWKSWDGYVYRAPNGWELGVCENQPGGLSFSLRLLTYTHRSIIAGGFAPIEEVPTDRSQVDFPVEFGNVLYDDKNPYAPPQ